jgi:hypothetical protein
LSLISTSRTASASAPAYADNPATAAINFDDGGFEQTRWLSWQTTSKGHPPDGAVARLGSLGLHAIGLKGYVRAGNFDGSVPADRLSAQWATHPDPKQGS